MVMRSLTPLVGLLGLRPGRWLAVAGLAAGLAWAVTPPALAQEQPPATEEQEQDQDDQQDEEEADAPEAEVQEVITVTARKREEALTDVPFSVVAPTEEILRERGATDLEDVAANVAGFNVQDLGPGQSQVAMRGVSAGQVVRDQPGVKEQVGVYLDESVISLSLFTPDIDLFDMNRIEVLRGPQGTLFGSGSLSGTVRYITNQPLIGVTEGIGEVTLSSVADGEVDGSAKVAINRPLGENLSVRVTAYRSGLPGYMDAVQPGLSVDEDVNGGARTGGRVAFKYQPNDRLSIVPRVMYQEVETDGWNRIDAYNILANPFTTTRPAVDLDEREQFIQLDEPFSDDFVLGDLTVGYAFDAFDLTSITSVTDRDIQVVRDAGALTSSITGGSLGLPEPVYTLDAPLIDDTTVQSLTQEVRFSGVVDRWTWLAGGFYSDIERDYGQSLPVTGFEDMTGIPTAGDFGAAKDVLFFSDLSYDFEQFALFGEATYALTDRFDLTGGLRYYDFEENRDQTFDGIFAAPGSTSGSATADGVVPRIIASYAVTDATTLNAQISEGFRLGGINDPLNVPLCTPEDLVTFGGRDTWEDETLRNYEVGSKSTILSGRGTFNAAAFFMDIEDLQVTATAGTCSSRIVFNVPEARSQGVELEFSVQPTTSFDFAISASYTDSELRSSVTSTDAQGNTSIVAGMREGNRLPTVPELQGAAAATYRWPVRGDWAAYLTGTFQHVGSRFTQTGDQAPGFGTVNLLALPNTIGGPLTQTTFTFDPELPSYDILNLRLGIFNDLWDVALFVNNVTDEIAFLALDQERGTLGRVGFLTNEPRTIGVTTRFKFW